MNPTYLERDGAAWILLDDGKANAMRTDNLRELAAMVDRAAADGAGAVVIRGREGRFSGGLDVGWLMTLSPGELDELVQVFSSTMLGVLASPVPTVALVSGHAVAGGAMLACACDRRIGLRGAYRLQLNEVAIGIPVPAWTALIASSAIPAPRCNDVLQLAEPLDFDEAAALGTLHALADDPEDLDRLGAEAAAALALLDRKAFATTRSRLWAEPIEQVRARLADEKVA